MMVFGFRFCVIGVAALFASSAAVAKDVSQAELDGVVRVLEANGCKMEKPAFEAAFVQEMGREKELSIEGFFELINPLAAEGRVNTEIGSPDIVVLYSESCGNAAENPYIAFMEVLEKNACKLTDSAKSDIRGSGLRPGDVNTYISGMLETGRARMVGAQSMEILAPYCTPK